MNVNRINNFNKTSALSFGEQPQIQTAQSAPPEASPVSAPVNADSALTAQAVKAQLDVKTPLSYSFLGSFEIPQAGGGRLYKLANGQKVAILNKKGPTVLKTYFNVGSMNEPDKIRGVSHFCEHMAFNGTENLGAGEFFKITNDMGAMTNASTGFSMTDYFISSQLLNNDDLENSIKIQADMLQKPKYAPEMVEKEKGPVTSEISMVGDVPENTALNNCIKNLFNIDTNSQDLVAGSISNIQNLDRDSAYDYYNTWYTPDNSITVVTGEVNPDDTMKLISKYFNSTRAGKPQDRKYETLTPVIKPVRQDIKMPKAQGTTVVLGFSGPQNSSERETVNLKVLSMLLFGYKAARVSTALDKMQLNAMMSDERVGNRPQDPRGIIIAGQSTPEKSEKMIKAIYDEINGISQKPITQEELNTVKNMLKLGYSNLCENSQALNSLIGTSLMDNNMNYAKHFLTILDSVTPEEMTEFAKKYLDLNKVSLSVVHPQSVDDKTIQDNYSVLNPVNMQNRPMAAAFKGRIDEKSFDMSKIKTYRLNNNMEVTFNPNKSDITTYEINLDAKIPAAVKPAVPVLLTVILNEGSKNKNYKELYADANKRGIDIKFSADYSSINAHATSLSDDANASMDLIKEVLTSPRFNESALKYAKSFVKEALLNSQETAADPLLKELFPNLAEFATKEEGLRSIEETTMSDIIAYYNYIMQNAQASGVFTAPVDKKPQIQQDVFNKFSQGLPVFKEQKILNYNSYTPIEQNKIITKADARNQADIMQAFKFKTNFNPKDHLTVALLNTILGDGPYSRLFNDLREKQKLAYNVASSVKMYGNTGVFALNIKTTTDNKSENVVQYENVKKSVDGFKTHIDKLKNEKVSQAELDSAKLRFKTKMLNMIESSMGQTNVLANSKNNCYGLNSLAEKLKLLDTISADDIYNAANYIFNSNSVTSILASQDTLDNMN